ALAELEQRAQLDLGARAHHGPEAKRVDDADHKARQQEPLHELRRTHHDARWSIRVCSAPRLRIDSISCIDSLTWNSSSTALTSRRWFIESQSSTSSGVSASCTAAASRSNSSATISTSFGFTGGLRSEDGDMRAVDRARRVGAQL